MFLVAPDRGLRAWLHDLDPAHPLAVLCRSTLEALGAENFPPLQVSILSTIPVASGLGSSAAVSVAIARALNGQFHGGLTVDRISELAFAVERIHHGTPSGIDNTVVAFDRPVFFRRDHAAETLALGAAFSLLIGDSGISAPTAEAVAHVRRRWEADRPGVEHTFDEIGARVERARQALLEGSPQALGTALRDNHDLLVQLGVSSRELDSLVGAALRAGALGAKMSGGGMGGAVIALVTPESEGAVRRALLAAGAAAVLQTEVAP
jgi:mevalonate kinase